MGRTHQQCSAQGYEIVAIPQDQRPSEGNVYQVFRGPFYGWRIILGRDANARIGTGRPKQNRENVRDLMPVRPGVGAVSACCDGEAPFDQLWLQLPADGTNLAGDILVFVATEKGVEPPPVLYDCDCPMEADAPQTATPGAMDAQLLAADGERVQVFIQAAPANTGTISLSFGGAAAVSLRGATLSAGDAVVLGVKEDGIAVLGQIRQAASAAGQAILYQVWRHPDLP